VTKISKKWTKEAEFQFQTKQIDDKTGYFAGLCATWSLDLGGDRIIKGAFADSIAKTGGKVPVLWYHRPELIIGYTEELRETDDGLFVRGYITRDTEDGKRVHALLKMDKSILKMSIGYNTTKERYVRENGQPVRVLEIIDLKEVSPVVFAMNETTKFTDVKSTHSGIEAILERLKARIKEFELKDKDKLEPWEVVSLENSKFMLKEIEVRIGLEDLKQRNNRIEHLLKNRGVR